MTTPDHQFIHDCARRRNQLCREASADYQSMKKYVTAYLRGDVMKAKDGSIGLITKAHAVTKTDEHIEWNYLWSEHAAPPDIIRESYAVDVIPGFPCSRLSWWAPAEFKEVLKGPMHEILGGDRKEKLDNIQAENLSLPYASTIAPLGRGHTSR